MWMDCTSAVAWPLCSVILKNNKSCFCSWCDYMYNFLICNSECCDTFGPSSFTQGFSSPEVVKKQHSSIISPFHHHLTLSLILPLCYLSRCLPLFSRDTLTSLSRSRLSSGELIVGGAYSWNSTTPTRRAKGEHLCYTTGIWYLKTLRLSCVSHWRWKRRGVWGNCVNLNQQTFWWK